MAQADFVEIGEAWGNGGELQAGEPAQRGIESFRALGVTRPVKCSLQAGSATRPVIIL